MITKTYKTADGNELNFDIFYPRSENCNYKALVLFFGGAWTFGERKKFYPQAEYFSSLGYTVFTPDYRVLSRQHATPKTCVSDALCFWRHLLENTVTYAIDGSRIAMGGGSSGGHLAIMAGIESGVYPRAYVLYNPAVNLILKRFNSISPARQLCGDFPPSIFLHGQMDTKVPLPMVRSFANRVTACGAAVRFYVYKFRGHGFFNRYRGKKVFNDTNRKVAAFLNEFL